MENQPFLLAESEDLSSIHAPLNTARRIKYTCFNVSNSFLIFGATSGGLYVFRREPCCFLQLLPNKEGSVTQLAISPDEKLIAFSTVKGIACVIEKSSQGAKHLISTNEHQNEQITCLQWNEGNNELFVGDNSGKVSILTVSVFPTKSMFQTPSFVLMQLDSKIVQMDFTSNMLLVSTLTKCYICDTTKEIFRQVGHKLRDGEYGACIFNTQDDHDVILDLGKAESEKISTEYSNLSHLKLLCARPGSRVWEVAIDGTVISTHHFKEALAVPPRKIIFLNNSSSRSNDLSSSILTNGSCGDGEHINSNYVEQSFNFQKLYVILSRFVLTFKSDGIYVFDPQKAAVVLWNNEITNIVDVKCVNDVIYIWSGFGKVYALNLLPLEKFLLCLYFRKKYLELAELCLEFETFLLSQAKNCGKLYVLHDLDVKLKYDERICDRLKPLLGICKENAQKRKVENAQKLKSGIYSVNNNDQRLLHDRQVNNQKLLRPNYLNLKVRSHSVSPERYQNGSLRHHGSSSSLPDLVKQKKMEESSISDEVVKTCKKGKGKKKKIIIEPKIDIQGVVVICEGMRKSMDPSKELVFSFFDQILILSDYNKLGAEKNLELVQSFNFKKHFSIEDVKVITDTFHSSLKFKLIFEWLSQFTGEWLTDAVQNYPDFLLKNLSNESLELDYKLSKVLKLFSDVLNEENIIELVKETDIECYFSCLLEILNIFQDSSSSFLSDSSLNLANITSTPKILNAVYFLMKVGQVEQCSKHAHKINLKDLFYLMLKFEDCGRKSGKSYEISELQSHTLFLSYLDKTPQANKLSGWSDLLENYIAICLENINSSATSVKESNCSCGFPCPGIRPSITMFPDVGYALIEKTWPGNPTKCMEICGKIPFLWKYLISFRRKEPIDVLLPLILQYGEIQELESRSHEVDDQILESSVKYLITLKKGNCLNCSKKIKLDNGTVSWTELGLLCIKLLGPKDTLQLFTKYADEIRSKDLDQSFYQGLIFSSIMDKHSKGLRKNVVDSLVGKGMQESYRVPVLSEELKTKIMGKSDDGKYTVQSPEAKFHHWGVKLNFKNNCVVCSLPLNTKVLISENGLVVFKCAHVFHSACVRKSNLECPVCKTKSTNEG